MLSFFGGGYYTVPLEQMEYAPAIGEKAYYDYSTPLGWIAGAAFGFKLGPGALVIEARWYTDFGNTSISDGKGTQQVYSHSRTDFFVADFIPTVSLGYEIGFIRRK